VREGRRKKEEGRRKKEKKKATRKVATEITESHGDHGGRKIQAASPRRGRKTRAHPREAAKSLLRVLRRTP
jgi:hypothetical protein